MKGFFTLVLSLFVFTFAKAEDKNVVKVCENSLELVKWDLEFIRHATRSIDIAPCFFGGKIAQEFLSAIEARLGVCPDLKVTVLTTPIILENEDLKHIELLKGKYPDNFHIEYATNLAVVWPDVSGIDNHAKLCVVDEKYFSMGGTNLETSHCSDGTFTPSKGEKQNEISSHLPSGTRDQDIVGRGPIAKQMRKTFCKLVALWNHYNKTHRLKKDPEAFEENSFYFDVDSNTFIESFEFSEKLIPLEEDQMSFFLGGPHQSENAITAEYVRLIRSAKNEIMIANLYVNPAKPILQALIEAVNRGVKLTIISNGLSEITPDCNKYFCWASRITYVPLFYGKTFKFWERPIAETATPKQTRIYEYHVEDVLLHKKIMIIDGEISLIGSYNLGCKSHMSDYETIMVMRSPAAARAFEEIYRIDKEYSREVSPEMAVEWYFDPLISYLGNLQKRFGGLL